MFSNIITDDNLIDLDGGMNLISLVDNSRGFIILKFLVTTQSFSLVKRYPHRVKRNFNLRKQ